MAWLLYEKLLNAENMKSKIREGEVTRITHIQVNTGLKPA